MAWPSALCALTQFLHEVHLLARGQGCADVKYDNVNDLEALCTCTLCTLFHVGNYYLYTLPRCHTGLNADRKMHTSGTKYFVLPRCGFSLSLFCNY